MMITCEYTVSQEIQREKTWYAVDTERLRVVHACPHSRVSFIPALWLFSIADRVCRGLKKAPHPESVFKSRMLFILTAADLAGVELLDG